MTDRSNDKDTTKNSICTSLVIFILWCVVLANSSKEQFDILNVTDYFNLAQFNTYGFLSIFVVVCCTLWLTVIAVDSENSCIITLAGIFNILMIVGSLVVVIWSLVLLGTVMDNHLEYTIPFYSKFWNTGLMNFTLADPAIVSPTIPNITNTTHGRHLRGNDYNLSPYSDLNYHKDMFTNHDSYLMNHSDDLNITFIANLTLTAMNGFHNYWKNYHNDLVNFHDCGKFPTHMAAQTKIAFGEITGNIKYNTTIQTKRRRLLEKNVVITKHWPFVMADVIVRISTGGLIIGLSIIATLGCCAGSAAGCSKICG